jgi:DNA ligase (NAD+)
LKKRIKELEKLIAEAQKAYYNSDEPLMSDAEYDELVDELGEIDPENEALKGVGAEPTSNEWKKQKHRFVLGSLNKVNTPEAMTEWVDGREVLVTEKLDGLSIGLNFENGELSSAILRGGGTEGEDILKNVLKMKGCIKTILGFDGVLRGEIVLLKSDHQEFFASYSNCRNAASGISRRFDGEGSEHLTLMFYQVLGKDFKTEEEQFKFLEKAGAIVPNYQVCKSADEVNKIWQEYIDTKREQLEFEIDGLVVSINDIAVQKSLGETNMRPKGKLAMKFPNQMARTIVKKIEFDMGSMGRCTPVCWVEPVDILGSIVQKASVYNLAYIKKLGLDIGAEVGLVKCGEIIPKIEKVFKGTGTTISAPINCPSCDTKMVMDGEYLVCQNTDNCPAQKMGRIKNYIKNLKVLEVGDALIEKLVEAELVNDISDLYLLTVDELAGLERMGQKSAENVYNSIWKHNPVPLNIFLGALSIPLIGKSSIDLIISSGRSSLKDIFAMKQEEMETIKGLGSARSAALYNGLVKNKEMIMKMMDNGLKIDEKKETAVDGKLNGKSFCFTGAMVNKRKILQQMVTINGGVNKDSVTKDLDFLVIEDHSTTKADKAKKLSVKLLSEADFLAMINE